MAALNQLASPKELTIGTPALTVTDLVSASINFDPELHEHFAGNSRFPHYVIGNDNTTMKFKTTDRSVLAKLIKGMEVKTVALKFAGPVKAVASTTPTYTSDTSDITASISCMRVTEAIEVSAESDKKPAEFEITLRAAKDIETNADPTITFNFTGTPEDPE